MSEDIFYRCIPELNKECKKNNCYINGGECETTSCKKYSLKGLLEEIERLNNTIKEAINYIDDNTYYKDHKGHINIDDLYIILQKGSDKE